MKPILPLTAALLLALSACKREAPVEATPIADDAPPATEQPVQDTPPATTPPAEPAPPVATDARFDGYGDMRFGMTADEAKQAWGGELKGIPAEGEACYHLSPKWVKVPAEFAFMIEGGKFVRYSTESDKYVAPGGGKDGMTIDEIRKLYPGAEEQPHKYVEGGKNLRIKDSGGSNGVLIFETDAAGKVTAWRVGVPPQVDYVEGCS
ncbi:MAG TPA: lectin [Pseudoxanthomonas sp.]